MQKTISKQQYENFVASRSEGLDKTYDRSLPPAWNTHTLIMRNKYDLDTLSMDDLFNNLKVYEAEIKGQSSSSPNSQNVAFVSSDNISSLNKAVNTAQNVSTAREVTLPESTRHQGVKGTRMETIQEGLYQWRLLLMPWLLLMEWVMIGAIKLKKVPTDFALMAFSSSGSSSSDTKLKNKLAECLQENDDLNLKLEKFETSSRNLTNLLTSQLSSKDKTGLGYDSQLNEKALSNKNDVFESAYDSSVNESKEDNNQANNRYKTSEGYHAVSPPYTTNFMPPKPDMSFVG
nr:hypothetical protein [Tanacetum cinerariifolium]